MTDIKSTLASLCERVDRTITKRFAEFALAAEKIGKTKEEVSEGNESNKKVKVIKISIFIQSIIAKKDSVEKCFGTFVNRENFLKTKDLKNKDKNNSAKREFPVKYSSKDSCGSLVSESGPHFYSYIDNASAICDSSCCSLSLAF